MLSKQAALLDLQWHCANMHKPAQSHASPRSRPVRDAIRSPRTLRPVPGTGR
ncbi:hypothetical protein J31TS4_10720 [Paenibacillus sp. J31TS4]|nr:hypothetical protein J31TS4_10720 [Paenibacillus sp. J31TS4]